jgi:hypothetical protein
VHVSFAPWIQFPHEVHEPGHDERDEGEPSTPPTAEKATVTGCWNICSTGRSGLGLSLRLQLGDRVVEDGADSKIAIVKRSWKTRRMASASR